MRLTVSSMQFNMDCEYRPRICGRIVQYPSLWKGRYVADHFTLRKHGWNAEITEYEVRLTDLVKRKCLYVSILQCMFRGWPFASPRPNEITTTSKNGADRWYYIVANCLVNRSRPNCSFARSIGMFSVVRRPCSMLPVSVVWQLLIFCWWYLQV
jgi:hypothetical protein